MAFIKIGAAGAAGAAGGGGSDKAEVVQLYFEDHRSRHGAGQPVAPSQRAVALAPRGRLLAIADGPHNLPWTHAEEVNAALLAFLRDGD